MCVCVCVCVCVLQGTVIFPKLLSSPVRVVVNKAGHFYSVISVS